MKRPKPVDYDAYFKYKCTNKNCSYEHWISLKEAQTKNFKIVCDCGQIIKPKRIDKLRIKYYQEVNRKKETTNTLDTISIDDNTLDKCCRVLINYGFTESEAKKLLKDSYAVIKSNDCSLLIKKSLESFGVNYEHNTPIKV